MEAQQREHEAEQGGQHNQPSDGHRHDAYIFFIEVRAHFVDNIGEPHPPCHGSQKHGRIAYHLLCGMIGHHKGETCKQGYEEQHDEGVGKGHEKCRDEVVEQCALVFRRGRHAGLRLAAEHVEPEDEEHGTACKLHLEHVGCIADEVHHERHAQACHQSIQQIADCSPKTGHQAIKQTFAQGALYAKDTYGACRRRGYHTDKQTL